MKIYPRLSTFKQIMRLHVSGMNQLLWYYADLEKQKCLEDDSGDGDNSPGTDFYAHLGGRRSNKVLYIENLLSK